MTANQLATVSNANSIMEDVIAKGDLGKLTPEQRAVYYTRVCESMGMNPLSKPFDYIVLNGKLTLYATKTASEQLRKLHGVSLQVTSEETTPDGIRVARVRATDASGRSDEEIGAVSVKGLSGDNLCNAYMKALTKAKRRATLSICGLGWMDETEIETTPARPINVNHETGEIVEAVSRPVVVQLKPAETHEDAPQRTIMAGPAPVFVPELSVASGAEPATTPQMNKLGAMLRERGIEPPIARELAGVGSVRDLSKRDASRFIEYLNSYSTEDLLASIQPDDEQDDEPVDAYSQEVPY